MAQDKAVDAVVRLAGAFARDLTPDTFAIYVEKLSDIEPGLLAAAVDQLIERSKFFPAIAELRETAARIAGLLPPTSAEALAIVRQADVARPAYRNDGSIAYMDRCWEWPADVSEEALDVIRDVLSKVGEPEDAEGETYFGWETGFQKTYELAADEEIAHVLADLSHAQLPAAKRPELVARNA